MDACFALVSDQPIEHRFQLPFRTTLFRLRYHVGPLWDLTIDHKPAGWTCVIMVYTFVSSFAWSWGPVGALGLGLGLGFVHWADTPTRLIES